MTDERWRPTEPPARSAGRDVTKVVGGCILAVVIAVVLATIGIMALFAADPDHPYSPPDTPATIR